MQKVKNKIAILETPGFNQVLFDALKVYILEARGEYRDDIEIAEMAMAVIESLKVSYRSPSNIPTKVKQVDLEDSIAEIKSYPDYEKQKKSYELGKQEIDTNDFLPKQEQDGKETSIY